MRLFELFSNASVNCFPITYVRIVNVPWTVKVTFITRNTKTSKIEGEGRRPIAKRILSCLEGNCFSGLWECYFITTLQTDIIRIKVEGMCLLNTLSAAGFVQVRLKPHWSCQVWTNSWNFDTTWIRNARIVCFLTNIKVGNLWYILKQRGSIMAQVDSAPVNYQSNVIGGG